MKLRLAALVMMVIGCSSGGNTKAPDAPAQQMDAPAGTVCTGVVYDACNPASSNCQSGMVCKNYPMPAPGYNVCVPAQGACPTTACPTQGSTAVSCNNMMFCKPAIANADCVSP
ncbi:MAG TPA: hypothetical protein VGF94_25780 [Kofleriaceae bacterium]|jgi:hypothetical protein